MMIFKRLILAVFIVPLMINSTLAIAKQNPSEHKGNILFQGIDLTKEQEEKINAIRKKAYAHYKNDFGKNMSQMTEQKQQIQSLLLSEKFDQETAKSLAKKMADQQTELRINKLKQQHEIFSVLTPEQKVKLKENMQKITDSHQKKMKHPH